MAESNMSESDLPANLDLRWLGRKLLAVQAEQATLRNMIEPIPRRMSGLEGRFAAVESRFTALEARIDGIEGLLNAIAVSVQQTNALLIDRERQ